jgi:hypothetical protein
MSSSPVGRLRWQPPATRRWRRNYESAPDQPGTGKSPKAVRCRNARLLVAEAIVGLPTPESAKAVARAELPEVAVRAWRRCGYDAMIER